MFSFLFPLKTIRAHGLKGNALWDQSINQSISQSVNFYSGLSDRIHFEDH